MLTGKVGNRTARLGRFLAQRRMRHNCLSHAPQLVDNHRLRSLEPGYEERLTHRSLEPQRTLRRLTTSHRLNGKAECVGMRGKCVAVVPERPSPQSRFPERECLGCHAVFRPTREWQRFHSASCRYAWHAQQRPARSTAMQRCSVRGANVQLTFLVHRNINLFMQASESQKAKV